MHALDFENCFILAKENMHKQNRKSILNLYKNLNNYNEYLLDTRIIIENSSHGLSYNGTYKSWIKFNFTRLIKER